MEHRIVDPAFDIDACLEKARNHLRALTHAHQETWRIGEARWDIDQETGIFTWSFDDGRKVTSPFQIIGTYHVPSGTFLWGWDHPSVLLPLRKDAETVLRFAEEHGIDFLQHREVACSEESAWDLAALATLLCDRQGAYRGPAGEALVFMTFGQIEMSRAL